MDRGNSEPTIWMWLKLCLISGSILSAGQNYISYITHVYIACLYMNVFIIKATLLSFNVHRLSLWNVFRNDATFCQTTSCSRVPAKFSVVLTLYHFNDPFRSSQLRNIYTTWQNTSSQFNNRSLSARIALKPTLYIYVYRYVSKTTLSQYALFNLKKAPLGLYFLTGMP